jgi:hypothetical protein
MHGKLYEAITNVYSIDTITQYLLLSQKSTAALETTNVLFCAELKHVAELIHR